MAVVALRTTYQGGEAEALIESMEIYLKASGKLGGTKNKKLLSTQSSAIEHSLKVFYNAQTREGTPFAEPDLDIPIIEAERLGKALGLNDAGKLEVKSKQAPFDPTKGYKGSTIGEITPSEAGTAYRGGRVGEGLAGMLQKEAMWTELAPDYAKKEIAGGGTYDSTNPAHVLKAVRTKLGSGGQFLKWIKNNDMGLYMALYNKAKNLVINKAVLGGTNSNKVVAVDSINIHFPLSDFKHPPFTFEIAGTKKNKLELQLMGGFEKKLMTDLQNTAPAILASSAQNYQDGLDDIITGKRKATKGYWPAPGDHAVEYIIKHGSIPMARIPVKKGKTKRKQPKPQRFISGAQISALVQDRLKKIMPQGPRRGPPLSPNILTERTGRFRRSIMVIPRYRENIMRYWYDPIYMSLVNTPRNPDVLISNTIRQVVQGLFGRQFAIVRGQ